MAKILIVDDEPGMRHVIINVLKPEGHQVFIAEDGSQAIETVKKERPQLLLLDMRLPDMDGLEILAEVKKIIPETPVIILSGFGDVESAVSAMKQGAFDYISKPFNVDEVLTLVRKALGTQTLVNDGLLRKSLATHDRTRTRASVSSGHKKKNVLPLIILLAIVSIAGGGFGTYTYLSSHTKDEIFTVPYSNPTSITYDGTSIWITDWVTQSFYQHKIDKMFTMVQTCYLQDSHPTGITFDGTYVWSSNSWESVIYKHLLDKTLTVEKKYKSPAAEPSGLYWDGVYLWICDISRGKIYQTKVNDKELITVKVYDAPGNNPIGMFSDGQHYWIGDAETSRMYKLSKEFSVIGVYTAPQFEDKKNRLSAIGWDGKMVWTCCDESQKIYRNQFKSLKKLNF